MNHRIALVTVNLSLDDKRMYHFMAKNLSKAGWRVEIINSHFEGKDSERIYFRKAAMSSERFISKVFSYRFMLKSLLESRADIAVFFDSELLKMLPKAKKIMPIQIIFDAAKEVKMHNSILKRKLYLADAIITETDEMSEYISEAFDRSCTVIKGEIDFDLLISLCDELEKGGRYNI